MTRLLTALIAAAALALPAAAGAAAEGPALTELGGTEFPSRVFVLTLPT